MYQPVFRIRYLFNGSRSDPKTKTDPDPGGKGKDEFFPSSFHVLDDSNLDFFKIALNDLINEK